jgi:uncharacterized membrane protein YccC
MFGLRLWASVCLALYVAFWLQLDNAYWAGTSAALVCQPQLGASLRKGWFRMIGTLVGAVAIVVLTAGFPQDRTAFLVGLALWGAACAMVATLLRNFGSYAAALAGYTAAIIASDQLGVTGGVNGDAFMLAIARSSEICIGIVSAGVVLAVTDLGGARGRLARVFAELSASIMRGFTRMLAMAGPDLPDTTPVRREFIRQVIALDPLIDQARGESTQLRYHSPVLQNAVDGLLAALAGWRAIATHLARLAPRQTRDEVAVLLHNLPSELRAPLDGGDAERWLAEPVERYRRCEAAVQRLLAFPAATPSIRLLADAAAEPLAGISQALNGLALLVADPARPLRRAGTIRLGIADWMPALVNAGRAFVAIGAVALFWIVTAWPNGAGAMTWAAITVILFAPRADQAYAAAYRFVVGNCLTAVFAAIVAFAVLPNLETFAGFSIAIGLFLVPAGALVAQPWQTALFIPMAANFIPILAPANLMSYDPGQFYNAALAIVGGCAAGAASYRLLPPLSPGFRARRLLALSLHDLRGLAAGQRRRDWQGHMHDRLAAMPDEATPLQRAELLAALSLGKEILRLRGSAQQLGFAGELDLPFPAIAQGDSGTAIAHLARFDSRLAMLGPTGADRQTVLRARASVIVLSELLSRHATYFDSGAPQ